MFRKLGLFSVVIFSIGTSGAMAATCILPTAPTVPTTLTSETEAYAARDAVFAYLGAGEVYMKCLEEERASHGETITADVTLDLDNKLATFDTTQNTLILAWNTSYGAFLSQD